MQSQFVPRSRKVRILATLGPASATPEMIRKLAEAGADAFRINMSHGTHDDHRTRIETVRALEKELDRPTTILADLQGPKLRVGRFADGKAELKLGQSFTLDRDLAPGDATRAALPHREIFDAVEAGTRLLVDDGKIVLRVIRADAATAGARGAGVVATGVGSWPGTDVREALKEDGYSPIEYHSNMEGDRHATLDWFKSYGGVLVSIKCLDGRP